MLYSNLRAFCAAAVILVAATSSQADPIELGWNSSPDASVAGYIVYVGRASGAYTETYNVGNTTTYTYPSAVAGQRYYFAVAAYDGQSIVGAKSSEVSGTTSPPPTAGTNVALASAGAVVTASSTYGSGFLPATVIDGRRAGTAWGTNGGWADATPGSFPDWIEVDFPTSYAISQVNVFSVQDNYATPVEPTASQTFTLYGLRDFQVQYWTGTAWATVSGGAVSGNNLVWRAITFSPVTTQKIRVLMNAAADGRNSRLTELEAYTTSTTPPPPTAGTNVALASAGAVATASSTYSNGYLPAAVIDGRRAGANWGTSGGWNDATANAFPDWLEVDFATSYQISQVNVFSVQDNYATPAEPTASQTFTLYGLRDFQVQYWTGTAWATVSGGAISGNNLVWRAITFSPVTTQKIRVLMTATADGRYSRVTELEAYTAP